MKEDLKPCPFCGGMASIYETEQGEDYLDEIWVIHCKDCFAEMRGNKNDFNHIKNEEQRKYLEQTNPDEKEDIIKAWNKRV